MSRSRRYASPTRQAQIQMTRDRILAALTDLLVSDRALPNQRDIARRAPVNPITVQRHYPTRQVMLRALWRKLTPVPPRTPLTRSDIIAWIADSFDLFEAFPSLTRAQVVDPDSDVRGLDRDHQIWRDFVVASAPNLPGSAQTSGAALLALWRSPWAWLSLEGDGGLSRQQAVEAAAWAAQTLAANMETLAVPEA